MVPGLSENVMRR